MLEISQATTQWQSLGVTKTIERATDIFKSDEQAFLKELRQTLQDTGSSKIAASSFENLEIKPSTVELARSENSCTCKSNVPANAPFTNFEEFRAWEKQLGSTFAKDYEVPDYIRMINISLGGGDSEAFGRYMFFKNNPQYAEDYESIRNGNLSTFPTDGSTLVKSDLSKLDQETTAYYKKDLSQLLSAEGFNMDPTLLKKRMEGDTEGMSDPDWLMQHRWTPDGVVASNNRAVYAQSAFIGLDGNGAENYRLAKFDPATGLIVDLDGRIYDPATGSAVA